MRLLSEADLRERGIRFSRQHREQLIRNGRFPCPVKIGGNTVAWIEAEIDAYVAAGIEPHDAIADPGDDAISSAVKLQMVVTPWETLPNGDKVRRVYAV